LPVVRPPAPPLIRRRAMLTAVPAASCGNPRLLLYVPES
jgi:hypothetical protein